MRQLGLVILVLSGFVSLYTVPTLIRLTTNPPSLIGGGGVEAVINWIVMIALLMAVTAIPPAVGIGLATKSERTAL